MDYSAIIGHICFVQSPHGLHYGLVAKDEYDYVIMQDARLIQPNEYENYSPEYYACNDCYGLVNLAGPVSFLQINNVKEIARVYDELIDFYAANIEGY